MLLFFLFPTGIVPVDRGLWWCRFFWLLKGGIRDVANMAGVIDFFEEIAGTEMEFSKDPLLECYFSGGLGGLILNLYENFYQGNIGVQTLQISNFVRSVRLYLLNKNIHTNSKSGPLIPLKYCNRWSRICGAGKRRDGEDVFKTYWITSEK